MSRLTDEVVIAVLAGPYVLVACLVVWIELLRERIKRLETRAEKKEAQWRIR